MYCQKCGNELDNDVKFCNVCGASVVPDTAPAYGYSQNGDSYNSPAGGMLSVDGVPPKKKGKKALIITLVSLAVVLIVAAAVSVYLFLFVFNWEDQLRDYVEERNWAEAEALYEKRVKGNEKREKKAEEIFEDAVDEIKDEYISEDMEYMSAKRQLEEIGVFWDDRYLDKALDEIQTLEAAKAASDVIGDWKLTEVGTMGMVMDAEEFLALAGMDGTFDMTIRSNGKFTMKAADDFGSGAWKYEESKITLDDGDETLEGKYEDDKITLTMDAGGIDVDMVFEKK